MERSLRQQPKSRLLTDKKGWIDMIITNPIGVMTLGRREIVRFLSVAGQTVFPPMVTSLLFLYIFGVALGGRIQVSETAMPYLVFIVPGLMTMHLISSSYENTSSSLFIARWHNHIQEVLLSPLSYFEMVLGLLIGGLTRGAIVSMGVYTVSLLFARHGIAHPLVLIYFLLTIATIFSCAGMIGALWAEDFGMLNVWNIYLIVPLVLLGGVFHPLEILPDIVQHLSRFNPMFYLVEGMRYAVTGDIRVPMWQCMGVSLVMAVVFFSVTVHLFKIGYKLRT